jgi:hypothetical protein
MKKNVSKKSAAPAPARSTTWEWEFRKNSVPRCRPWRTESGRLRFRRQQSGWVGCRLRPDTLICVLGCARFRQLGQLFEQQLRQLGIGRCCPQLMQQIPAQEFSPRRLRPPTIVRSELASAPATCSSVMFSSLHTLPNNRGIPGTFFSLRRSYPGPHPVGMCSTLLDLIFQVR